MDTHNPLNISLKPIQVIRFDHFLTINRFVFQISCLNFFPISVRPFQPRHNLRLMDHLDTL